MKTKNNVQKTILRSIAVVVSFVLISLTVNGQDFWKKLLENSSFNEIALAMVETPKTTENPVSITDNFIFLFLENENDPTLNVESWMVNDNLFGGSGFEFIQESDSDLEIEEWMLDESLFHSEECIESALEIEDWMTSEELWEV
ncbi:MAG: hypothetical protein KAH68_02755 [Draconibacterium sp.]|nr:hypothetical protein [Draconibacterium sp.]